MLATAAGTRRVTGTGRGKSSLIFTAGGVLVSTGWQEVQIACRGWSAGHDKSRPQLQLPKLSFLWLLS